MPVVTNPTPGQRIDPSELVGPKPIISEPRPFQLRRPGDPPIPPSAPAQKAGVMPVPGGSVGDFLSMLPPRTLTPWHRVAMVPGATAFAAAPSTYTSALATTPQGYGLVIFDLKQYWLDEGLDPLDPDALQAMQDFQAFYGRVGMTIQARGSASLWDAQESLIDPNGGAYTPRTVYGFSILNQNLLYLGMHPTAVYVPENTPIDVAWTVQALPDHIPSAVGVSADGYLMPTKVFNQVLEGLRPR